MLVEHSKHSYRLPAHNISTLQYNTECNSTVSTVQDSSSQYSTQHTVTRTLRHQIQPGHFQSATLQFLQSRQSMTAITRRWFTSCQRLDHVLWHCVGSGVQHSLMPRALLTLVPALVVSNINYYNSVLAGVSVHSCTLSAQTAVRAKCCGSADLLGNEVRTHQPATAPTPLAVCSGRNSILDVHFHISLPLWHSTVIPGQQICHAVVIFVPSIHSR